MWKRCREEWTEGGREGEGAEWPSEKKETGGNMTANLHAPSQYGDRIEHDDKIEGDAQHGAPEFNQMPGKKL